MNKESFYSEAQKFLHFLESEMKRTKVQLASHWSIDHICYRAETLESYLANKNYFNAIGELLIASDVNGREIATFKLFTPLSFLGREISLLELPAPKKGKVVKEGFEHVEVVVDKSFAEIRRTHPCHFFDEKGLQKDFNQELEMGFDDCAIKFHHLSLESVINLEKNEKAFRALKNSKVLDTFKKFHPLVVGTFPLNLHQKNSDLDIILYAENLEELKSFEGFKWQEMIVQDQPTLLCSFDFEGIPFELFAQSVPTHDQVAFRHFQVEERLLRLGGEKFFEKVKAVREKGLKTEPAFYEALGLSGDAYKGLLELHALTEKELKANLF